MNRHFKLLGSTLMIAAGLGLTHAIAAEPTPQSANQRPDICQQAGVDYRELYTIEEDTRSITICQKGTQYYHIITQKPSQQTVSSMSQDANQAPSTLMK